MRQPTGRHPDDGDVSLLQRKTAAPLRVPVVYPTVRGAGSRAVTPAILVAQGAGQAAMTLMTDEQALIAERSTDDLINEITVLRSALKITHERLDRLTSTVIRRMEESGAKALPHPHYDIKLDLGTPAFDLNKVRSEFGEFLPESDMHTLILPEGTKVTPARVDGRRMRSVIIRYGRPAEERAERCRLPAVPKLIVKGKAND
jgi:hypothetical protein